MLIDEYLAAVPSDVPSDEVGFAELLLAKGEARGQQLSKSLEPRGPRRQHEVIDVKEDYLRGPPVRATPNPPARVEEALDETVLTQEPRDGDPKGEGSVVESVDGYDELDEEVLRRPQPPRRALHT